MAPRPQNMESKKCSIGYRNEKYFVHVGSHTIAVILNNIAKYLHLKIEAISSILDYQKHLSVHQNALLSKSPKQHKYKIVRKFASVK